MKRVYDTEQQRIHEMQKFYDSQSQKQCNYTEDDFSIDSLSNKWKHKSWKTWMKGGNDYAETKVIIRKYIAECKKPYGSRNLSEFHLY